MISEIKPINFIWILFHWGLLQALTYFSYFVRCMFNDVFRKAFLSFKTNYICFPNGNFYLYIIGLSKVSLAIVIANTKTFGSSNSWDPWELIARSPSLTCWPPDNRNELESSWVELSTLIRLLAALIRAWSGGALSLSPRQLFSSLSQFVSQSVSQLVSH